MIISPKLMKLKATPKDKDQKKEILNKKYPIKNITINVKAIVS